MREPKSDRDDAKGEWRFSQKQYDMVVRCCGKKQICEWKYST